MSINLEKVFKKSDQIIAREISGEIIIITSMEGRQSKDDEIYSLSSTGAAIWKLIDGNNNLRQVCDSLAEQYNAPLETIEKDVINLVNELVERKLLVEISD